MDWWEYLGILEYTGGLDESIHSKCYFLPYFLIFSSTLNHLKNKFASYHLFKNLKMIFNPTLRDCFRYFKCPSLILGRAHVPGSWTYKSL